MTGCLGGVYAFPRVFHGVECVIRGVERLCARKGVYSYIIQKNCIFYYIFIRARGCLSTYTYVYYVFVECGKFRDSAGTALVPREYRIPRKRILCGKHAVTVFSMAVTFIFCLYFRLLSVAHVQNISLFLRLLNEKLVVCVALVTLFCALLFALGCLAKVFIL